MHVTGKVASRRRCEWCYICVCVSADGQTIHTNGTV